MTYSFMEKQRVRKNFGKTVCVCDKPNLLSIQLDSFQSFLQSDIPHEERENVGLQRALMSVFPIYSRKGDASVEFIKYDVGEKTFTISECLKRGRTYSAALNLTLRTVLYDAAHNYSVYSVREQDFYVGDIPIMTDTGSFIINGSERVVISQMHRSPGIFFVDANEKSSTHPIPTARIIPYRGSWLDFEFSSRDLIYFRVDKKKKLYATTFLKAMGLSEDNILDLFYDKLEFKVVSKGRVKLMLPVEALVGTELPFDLLDREGNVVVYAKKRVTKIKVKDHKNFYVDAHQLIGMIVYGDIYNGSRLLAFTGSELDYDVINRVVTNSLPLTVLLCDSPYIINTLVKDTNAGKEEALADIYKVLRPGNAATLGTQEMFFYNLFFNEDTYNLSDVGRMKLNSRLGFKEPYGKSVLQLEDICSVLEVLIDIKEHQDTYDDIDTLSNRRVRGTGEMLENVFRTALISLESDIKDKLLSKDLYATSPSSLIPTGAITSRIRNFFNSSQLAQFMDQINPLSEITHKRRLSALGPGGLVRERAGFEVRDVHPSHYGRLCPIETPEGGNIGLINTLSMFARTNKYGFIETAYKNTATGQIQYLSSHEELKYKIAPYLRNDDSLISCRTNNDIVRAFSTEIDYVDVSPQQMVSAAASMIPFLEHDDANRALMGANMQRQAVPTLYAEAPLIGTGTERLLAEDSRAAVTALRGGTVMHADGKKITITVNRKEMKGDNDILDIYYLTKYARSNQGTCINQKTLVKPGDVIAKGDVIADGPSTSKGELALGQNILIAFMPWNGYNYEDSILVSERVVEEDRFTSIHIEEFVCTARTTKFGNEEITDDIPNVSSKSLSMLDSSGIVPIGTVVNGGDMLVGKITPKGEEVSTPEEKLLFALFGSKSTSVKDTSLRMPSNKSGVVTDVVIFDAEEEKEGRAKEIEDAALAQARMDIREKSIVLRTSIFKQTYNLLLSKVCSTTYKNIKANSVIKKAALDAMKPEERLNVQVTNEKTQAKLDELYGQYYSIKENALAEYAKVEAKIKTKDSLPVSTVTIVKVYVTIKHRIQPGDKLAGRHGNKGCISAIMPVEDMPHLEDGTPVDIVLNPLGVPSRMNIGQVLETHFGLAAKALGNRIDEMFKKNVAVSKLRRFVDKIYEDKEIKNMSDKDFLLLASNLRKGIPFASPVFDGATEEDIDRMMKLSRLKHEHGKFDLYDGRTGEKFDNKIMIGYMYMLKLNHLVAEKMHARSIGPYSLVTQQPLGGKSQFGGQRLGEMEVWALESYGAAHTLQEMLTIKSDDVDGRYRAYKDIIEGKEVHSNTLPESFNVLSKELNALGLNFRLERD